MRLKRLEIIGFKSFPDKCIIDFPLGISAIVGPNGCGKSNIIDAIKWVMGEQSIKQLRGKSMGDVIFSGTEKRLQLNMAEVSLTLSNDTPETVEADLSQLTEIMITRRLFRSGESAYLINKQPCRLKDIHNVFLGSGMGAKSCAIVQQGNIGAITDAAPEERRTFIEEAAGVTRYKTRKNEAINKVNSTNHNLLRLNDIIDEIKKQMNSLRRQARKAMRYKDFREGLKKSDILVSVYYHELYASQIANTRNLLSELKKKDSSHASELQKLNAALDKIKSDRLSKDQIILRKKSEKSDAERTVDKLKNDLKYLRNEEKRLYAEITGLDAAIIDLEAKNQKIKDEIAEETVKRKNLGVEIEENKVALGEKSSASQEIRTRLSEQQKNLEEQKKQLMYLMAQKAKFQNIFKNAESNKENLRQRIKRIKKDELEISGKISKLKKVVLDAKENLQEISDARESVKRRIAEKKEHLDDQGNQLGQQIKTVNLLFNERNKIKSEYLTLKKMDDNYEWYKDGVKAVMTKNNIDSNDSSSTERNGIIGITADGLEPDPGFEIALEAALGETLQYIVIKDQQTGIASINYLRESNTGRSGFIPISTFQETAGKISRQNHDLPLLINHVTIKPGFEGTFAELLQDIAVAEDFDAALKTCTSNNGYRKVVTKNGDIISSNGIMVGGSQEKLSGIYKKKLALKQLNNQLTELDAALASGQKIQNDLESAVKNLEVDIQKLTVQKNNIEKEIIEAEKNHFQASESLKYTLSHYEIITLEKEKLLGEKTDIEDEIAAHDASLADISKSEETAELEIKKISDQISSLSEQIKAFNQTEMDLKLSLTRLNAELENTNKTLIRLKEFQTEGLKQTEQIKKDIIIKTQKSKQAASEINETEKELSDMLEGLNSININLQDHDADYQHIVSEITKTDDTINQTKTIIEEVRQKEHQLELELSGFNIKRENVVNRFLDRYSQSFSQSLAEFRETVQSPDFPIEKTEAALASFRKKIDRIGDVNLGAIEAYEEQKTRYEFLKQQRDDLVEAIEDLQSVIKKISRITQKLFMEMFNNVNEQFKAMFPRLFAGGSAWLELTQPNTPLETGVELMIHPPGKKVTRLSLLSGGEKALSAIAFIFSIFLINPASYCLLDEIDAPLDEANTNRFNELLKIIGEKSQIIMISHNKRSMEFSDMLFGVTMGESGVSKLVSVDIEKLSGRSNAQN
ncbi:MAG: chromosome segregation protein SMC [Desulfobacteraceae bacterium]|nr:chromosome segregation protein SMC [Desulfobacteraceae bacterium]MBC2757757.1 chromosome segregation protein SMC [Desulfobacteraceae bacterium]